MLFVKIGVICAFCVIAFQDINHRAISIWPLFLVLSGITFLHYKTTLVELLLINSMMNIVFIGVILMMIWLYAKVKMRCSPKQVIGLGDVLVFFILCFSFPTISFITIFIFSLLFSLIIHLISSKQSSNTTVPLAGYMSIFYGITYLAHWFNLITNPYIL